MSNGLISKQRMREMVKNAPSVAPAEMPKKEYQAVETLTKKTNVKKMILDDMEQWLRNMNLSSPGYLRQVSQILDRHL